MNIDEIQHLLAKNLVGISDDTVQKIISLFLQHDILGQEKFHTIVCESDMSDFESYLSMTKVVFPRTYGIAYDELSEILELMIENVTCLYSLAYFSVHFQKLLAKRIEQQLVTVEQAPPSPFIYIMQ